MRDEKAFSYPYGFLSRKWNSDRAIQDDADYKNYDADFWNSDHQNFPDQHQNSAGEHRFRNHELPSIRVRVFEWGRGGWDVLNNYAQVDWTEQSGRLDEAKRHFA